MVDDAAHTLRLLKKLQDCQLETTRLEYEIARVPEEIADLERETEEEAAAVLRAEDALKEEQKRSKQLELELESAQQKLSHYNEQILKVKTNEQLWALQKEIEFSNKKISDLETQSIESMELMDKLQEELDRARKEAVRIEEENNKNIESGWTRLEQMKADLEGTKENLEQTQREIPSSYVELFERIQQAKGGQAVAVARDGICQACYFRIRPQIYIDVRNAKGIFQCENCRRILFYEEEPPLENPAEIS